MNTTKKRKQTRTFNTAHILPYVLKLLRLALWVLPFLASSYSDSAELEDATKVNLFENEHKPIQEIVEERITRKSPREHPMKLREGYNMSQKKKAEAIERGIDVPNGYTLRGKNQIA